MIPTLLTIQGLYSYKTKQTIDFERLTSAGLFGIFGKVGSGKSTVLEAMMLALYGKSPREQMDTLGNLFNLESKILLIEFEFRAGSEGILYKAVFSAKRKKDFTVGPKTHVAYRWEHNEWVPKSEKTRQTEHFLTEVIGLSYNNFEQVVIIPQNKFSQFLTKKGAERTAMLMEIFDLQRFDLADKVKSELSHINNHLIALETKLEGLKEATQAQIDQWQARLKENKAAISEKDKHLEALEKQIQKFDNVKRLQENYTAYQNKLQNLSAEEPFWVEQKKLLHSYVGLRNAIDRPYALWQQNEQALEKSTSIKTELASKLKELTQARRVFQQKFSLTEAKYKNLEQDRQEVLDLIAIKKGITCKEEYREVERQIQVLSKEITSNEKSLNDDQQVLSSLESKKKNLESSLPELNKFNGMIALSSQWRLGLVNLEDDQKKLQKTKEELNSLYQEALNLLGTSELENWEDKEHELQKKARELQEQIEKAQALQFASKDANEILSVLASDLEEGKPCPLCGSVHHPQAFTAESENEKLAALQLKKEKKDRIQKQLQGLQGLQAERKASLRQKENLEAEVKKQQSELKDFKQQAKVFLREEISYKEFENQLALIQEDQQTLQALIREIEKIDKGLKERREFLSEKKIKFSALETKKENLLATMNSIRDEVQELDVDDFRGYSSSEVEVKVQEKKNEIESTERNYQAQSQQLATMNEQYSVLTSQIQRNNNDIEASEKTRSALYQELTQASTKLGYANFEEAKKVLEKNLEIDQEQEKINSFFSMLNEIKAVLEQITSEMKGLSYNEEEHNKVVEEKAELQSEMEEIKNENAVMLDSIARTVKLLEDKKKISDELAGQNKIKDQYKVMERLFKAKGFVNFISQMYMRNIVENANKRFKVITRNQLELDLNFEKKDENPIKVRDYLNGGALREAGSLSGGQAFQASLCLALALGDSVRKQLSSNQRFFFLDEGFGTQDDESLEMVLATLKDLQKEHRTVGVISHRQDVQQAIPVHLSITLDNTTGSQITIRS